MQLGIPLQHFVEIALQEIDAGVDLGCRHDRRRRNARVRRFGGELLAERVTRILGLAQLQSRFAQLFVGLGDLGDVVACPGAEQRHVAQAEVLETVLGIGQLLLVAADLILDETPRRIGVLAFSAKARFHEQRQQRLHDALCALRLHVFVRERE